MTFWDFADRHEWMVGTLVVWVSLMGAISISSIAGAIQYLGGRRNP